MGLPEASLCRYDTEPSSREDLFIKNFLTHEIANSENNFFEPSGGAGNNTHDLNMSECPSDFHQSKSQRTMSTNEESDSQESVIYTSQHPGQGMYSTAPLALTEESILPNYPRISHEGWAGFSSPDNEETDLSKDYSNDRCFASKNHPPCFSNSLPDRVDCYEDYLFNQPLESNWMQFRPQYTDYSYN